MIQQPLRKKFRQYGQISAYLRALLRKEGITEKDATLRGAFDDSAVLALIRSLRVRVQQTGQDRPPKPV